MTLAVCAGLAVPAQAQVAERAGVRPASGSYTGTTLDEGQPTKTEYVRFKVAPNGRKMTGFKARIGMYCYLGPPVFNQIVPTVFTVPPTTIKNGKIDRGWTEQIGTGADAVALTGRIKMTVRNGRPTKGKVAVDFGSCGTTTATPAGYVKFQVKRGR